MNVDSLGIVVMGSINIDLTMQVREFPHPGETVAATALTRRLGGKGANQAVAAARLARVPVSFLGQIGADSDGNAALASLRQEANLSTSHVLAHPHQPTGQALIYVNSHGENMIAVFSGANGELSPEWVGARLGSIPGHAVLLTCCESPMVALRSALRTAKQRGWTTILNPAPAPSREDYFAMAPYVDILTPNQREAESLTGIEIGDGASADSAAHHLLRSGPQVICLTRGAAGCLALTRTERWSIAAPHVSVVDTTGAGDAFNGALAVAWAESMPLGTACEFAVRAASLSVQIAGAQAGLPSRHALEANLTH